jgi:hypothetical protein
VEKAPPAPEVIDEPTYKRKSSSQLSVLDIILGFIHWSLTPAAPLVAVEKAPSAPLVAVEKAPSAPLVAVENAPSAPEVTVSTTPEPTEETAETAVSPAPPTAEVTCEMLEMDGLSIEIVLSYTYDSTSATEG